MWIEKLAQEFNAQTAYLNSSAETLRSIKSRFPAVELRSFNQFRSFLDRYLKTLIRKYLVGTKSVKNCSGISPDFSEFAAAHGYAVLTEKVPGHVRNIFLSDSGPYVVDLSYVQFTCGYDGSNPENLISSLREVYHNPEKAIRIEKLPLNYFGNTLEPHGEYDSTYDPKKFIDFYDQDEDRQSDDIEAIERWDRARKKKQQNGTQNIDTDMERQR